MKYVWLITVDGGAICAMIGGFDDRVKAEELLEWKKEEWFEINGHHYLHDMDMFMDAHKWGIDRCQVEEL